MDHVGQSIGQYIELEGLEICMFSFENWNCVEKLNWFALEPNNKANEEYQPKWISSNGNKRLCNLLVCSDNGTSNKSENYKEEARNAIQKHKPKRVESVNADAEAFGDHWKIQIALCILKLKH
ncbi:hypothetical protein JHK86_012577 [Glycine max]|nr:hypothetical protein JHK86_012577 [Glycine max]